MKIKINYKIILLKVLRINLTNEWSSYGQKRER